MSTITVAATQMACTRDLAANIERAESLVRRAASRGANIVLLQELFETPYFCKDQLAEHFDLAHPVQDHPLLGRMGRLAAELGVVLPVSFFERAGTTFFNSLMMFDADGAPLGLYRKSHIPNSPGYQEKYYFSPGDTGFKVWRTRFGAVGAAICWDQWFPEAARAMALGGADVLLYPTAIGSEPVEPELDSRDHWRRVMQGHAAANMIPVVASNRIGHEQGQSCALTFYGSSFIAGPTGELVAEAGREEETVLLASFDPQENRKARTAWCMFRDRRPDLYGTLLTLDGADRG